MEHAVSPAVATTLVDRPSRTRVLVTSARGRATLAAIRALDAAGYRVIASAPQRGAVGFWSRHADRRLVLTDPAIDPIGFATDVACVTADLAVGVVLPGSDAAVSALSVHRRRVPPGTRIGLPDRHAVERTLDKLELHRAAVEVGMPAPATRVCPDVNAACHAARAFGFPVVVKPHRSFSEPGPGAGHQGGLAVGTVAELRNVIAAWQTPVLVQERLTGPVSSFSGIATPEGLLATCLTRYWRTWPPFAGNAAFAETVPIPATLLHDVERLVSTLGWHGIFELEMLPGPDGRLTPIDFNPRVYGSMALAIKAGANLPVMWVEYLLGAHVQPVSARPFERYRWEDGDVRHAGWLLARGELAAAAAVVRPRRNVTHAHISASDPMPMIGRAVEMVVQGLRQRRRKEKPLSSETDVAVVGAGPYGLSVAAYLRFAGIEHRIFGDIMSSWRAQMPEGMVLRSSIRASAVAHPQPGSTLSDWAHRVGRTIVAPVPLDDFLDYTAWYAQRNVDPVDPRHVISISTVRDGFALDMSDGERLSARRVVVALGFENCARRPAEFDGIETEFVSHVADNLPLDQLRGRRVAVVGSGQSALESAALAAEAGAHVQIVARAASVHWLHPLDARPASRLPQAPTDIGGFVTGWLAAAPDVYHVLPGRARAKVDKRCLQPAAAHALRDRLAAVPMHLGERVKKVSCQGGVIELVLSGGDILTVDHVLLGTGYDVDVARFRILPPELLRRLDRRGTGLKLGSGFESSLPGLHFVGAPAVPSFGPVNRFVTGTWYAAPAVTARLQGRRGPALKVGF